MRHRPIVAKTASEATSALETTEAPDVIDNATRDRILQRMGNANGLHRVVAETIGLGINTEGDWDTARANGYLSLLSDRRVLERVHEIEAATTVAELTSWPSIVMVDAACAAYHDRNIAPLVDWLDTYADELDR